MNKLITQNHGASALFISLILLFFTADATALNNLKPISDLIGPTPFGSLQPDGQTVPVETNSAPDAAQDTARITTRFGELTIGASQELLYRGHPLRPSIRANRALEISKPLRVGTSDVVLVTNAGGTACPYLYHFVTIRKSGAIATSSFGTCSEALSVKQAGNSIAVAMHGYRGPFEPEAIRKKAASETHTFVFRDNVILQDGRPTR